MPDLQVLIYLKIEGIELPGRLVKEDPNEDT
jgi:hypothetical protein